MKKIRSFFWPVVILCVGCVSANAQWQTPNHSVPIGRGSGTGFKSTGPSSTSGQPLISQGASSDPVFGTATVPGGGTGATSFTSNLPLIGNGTGAIAQGTRGGNTTSFATTSGALTSGNCVSIDANGNFVAFGGSCGGTTVATQSGDYTILTSDCGKIIGLTGTFKTITLPSAAGFSEGCAVYLANTSTTRAQVMSGFPASLRPIDSCGTNNFCLWPSQIVGVQRVNSAWVAIYSPGKFYNSIGLYADSASGSDNNDCLSSGAGACATMSKLVAIACSLNSQPTVDLYASGTYHNFSTGGCGQPRLIAVHGNPSATFNDNGSPGIAFECVDTCTLQLGVSGTITLSVTGTASQNLVAQRGAVLDVTNTTFTSSAGANGVLVISKDGANVNMNGSNTIAGGGGSTVGQFFLATRGGTIIHNSSYALTGTWTTTNTCNAQDGGTVDVTGGYTGAGTVTGQRWIALLGSVKGTPNTNCPGSTVGAFGGSTINQVSLGNPGSTTNTTGRMAGLGASCSITPAYSSRVKIDFYGAVNNNTSGDGAQMTIYYGTGTAPANGDAVTGTIISAASTYNGSTITGQYVPFTVAGMATGLTPGTTYWFDLKQNAVTGGTVQLANMGCTGFEF